MIQTDPQLTARDGTPIRYQVWPATQPRALVLILHGMAEHTGRYDALARTLCPHGYTVWAVEYRGHGQGAQKLGYFAPQNGFELVCDDVMRLYRFMHQSQPELPVLLFAHSMGTIFARALLMSQPNPVPKGCLLSGVTVDVPVRRRFAPAMIGLIGTLQNGMDQVSPLVMRMSIGAFGASVKDAKTDCDWLSRDAKAVQAYRDDPLCGFELTSAMMRDVARGVLFTLRRKNERNLPSQTPVRICVGDCDPVGGVRAAQELKRRWQRLGKPVSVSIYPGARHELLNETCRDEFLGETVKFFDQCLQ